MNEKIIGAIVGGALALGFVVGWYVTDSYYEGLITEYIQKAERAEKDALTAKMEADKNALAQIHEIERGYLAQLNEQKVYYEKTIGDLRANFNPSGLLDSSGSEDDLSRTESDPARVVCYKQSELYGKIERSLAIANEADKLAMRHEALVKVCNEQ